MTVQDLIGVPPGSWNRRAVRKAELATLPLFQLIPHLLIALDVAQSPDAFSAKVRCRLFLFIVRPAVFTGIHATIDGYDRGIGACIERHAASCCRR